MSGGGGGGGGLIGAKCIGKGGSKGCFVFISWLVEAFDLIYHIAVIRN